MKTIYLALKAAVDLEPIDAQLLLAHVLQQTRTFLLTFPEQEISAESYSEFIALVNHRRQGQPIAYLLGKKAFWELELEVTPAVLIPRPETELIVEWVLNRFDQGSLLSIADLGTGSGAIALSIAQARPHWSVVATDLSFPALEVAKKNAANYGLNQVKFFQGKWCQALPDERFNLIISNPPYIDPVDPHLQQGDVRFEPRSALIADQQGLADLLHLINEAKQYLKSGGYLVLEHGYDQGAILRDCFEKSGYYSIETFLDYAGHQRVTLGRWMGSPLSE